MMAKASPSPTSKECDSERVRVITQFVHRIAYSRPAKSPTLR